IAHVQILRRRQAFARETKGVQIPDVRDPDGDVERKGLLFPFSMENGLVDLRLNWAKAVHSAHVRRAAHLATSSERFGKPVPTILSALTRSARCSSLQPSVPSGRSGITR